MTEDREQALLALVPTDGSGIGNTRLLRQLKWPEEEFWDVRNRLVDRGLLELGRGRGGSVRLVQPALPEAPAPGTEPPPGPNLLEDALELGREADLYQPLKATIEEKWTRDKRVESAIVHLTAYQGRKKTGIWTRPDITVATLSTYSYVPGRHFDVITFEIKPCDAIDVTCIYEALAHLRAATQAYVLIHVPAHRAEVLEESMLDVCAEGKKHGIGVITFESPSDYETCDERVEPTRREPEPRKLNDFLAKQFTQSQLERIVRWFR